MNLERELIDSCKGSVDEILKKIEDCAMSSDGSICAVITRRSFTITWVEASAWHKTPYIAFGGCETREDIIKRIKEKENEMREYGII